MKKKQIELENKKKKLLASIDRLNRGEGFKESLKELANELKKLEKEKRRVEEVEKNFKGTISPNFTTEVKIEQIENSNKDIEEVKPSKIEED